jgi:hypothetical protein
MLLDIFCGRSILCDRDELPILIEPTERNLPEPEAPTVAPLASGLEVIGQVLAHEALGDSDFQLTPAARMDVRRDMKGARPEALPAGGRGAWLLPLTNLK